VDSCYFTNKANSHTPKVEVHTRQILCQFGRSVAKAKLFCLKGFVPVTRARVFICENFHPGYRDLGNRVSPASQINTSKFLRRQGWQGEISETEPARLTGLVCRGTQSVRSLVSRWVGASVGRSVSPLVRRSVGRLVTHADRQTDSQPYSSADQSKVSQPTNKRTQQGQTVQGKRARKKEKEEKWPVFPSILLIFPSCLNVHCISLISIRA